MALLNDTRLKQTLKNINIKRTKEKVILRTSQETILAFWLQHHQISRKRSINLVLRLQSTDQIRIQEVDDLQQEHHILQSTCETQKNKFP